jgi:hypothetical protein
MTDVDPDEPLVGLPVLPVLGEDPDTAPPPLVVPLLVPLVVPLLAPLGITDPLEAAVVRRIASSCAFEHAAVRAPPSRRLPAKNRPGLVNAFMRIEENFAEQ